MKLLDVQINKSITFSILYWNCSYYVHVFTKKILYTGAGVSCVPGK